MLISKIPKTWRLTREGIWHQPRKNLRNGARILEWKIYYQQGCKRCGMQYVTPQKWRPYCTTQCANQAIKKTGKEHPRWKNGRAEIGTGYVLIKTGYKKYSFEHRLVMEKKIGRKLLATEIVHHINGIKNDNRASNLVITTRAAHIHIHKPGHGNKIRH